MNLLAMTRSIFRLRGTVSGMMRRRAGHGQPLKGDGWRVPTGVRRTARRGRFAARMAASGVALLATGCAALSPAPMTTEERLAMFPTSNLPLERPVTVRWDQHQVPFIEAETDRDLAFTLGLVHGHLRGAQIALMKRISQGRLSEMAGPMANDLDHALRILDFGHAAEDVLRNMPEESRAFLQAFVDGLNHQQKTARRQPPEFALLGIKPEPYTARDLLAIGRLAGTDVNWIGYVGLLAERAKPEFSTVWNRTLQAGMNVTTSFEIEPEAELMQRLLLATSRSGSNTVAVMDAKSASGGAMIASDPHLGLTLPNLWVLAGMRSPSYHTAGLMIPGLPFVAVGRNPDIAWGGTNMRAASSDLYDVSGLPREQIETREVTIRTRFWTDTKRTVRRSPFGPILSDIPFIRAHEGEEIAVRWVGHEPTDEVTALLRASRAETPQQFREAFAGFGVSAQNMIFADRYGNIGQIMAVTQPNRTVWVGDNDRDPVLDATDPETHWNGFLDALDLPFTINPASGVLASANNKPTNAPIPVGFFFSDEERVTRLYEILQEKDTLDFDDLAALQTDTVSLGAREVLATLIEVIEAAGGLDAHAGFVERLRGWDGRYDVESRGAVAFETLLYHLVPRLNGVESASELASVVNQWSYLTRFLPKDLMSMDEGKRARVLEEAVSRATVDAARYETWGDMHRLRLAHALANMPVLGGRFVYGDIPTGGSRETAMKTAHGLVNERHYASYGSMARHIADMSDPDSNWFALVGGQDGWLGSANFDDQMALWRERRYLQLPLTPEAVKAAYPHVMTLTPEG
jgi:penicillin amidase